MTTDGSMLFCTLCGCGHKLPSERGTFREEVKFAVDTYLSALAEDWEIINLDGELTPITKKVKEKGDKYFVTSQIRERKKGGTQLVLYAGEKGSRRKSERCHIMVHPDDKRFSFDQNDLHPTDLFVKVEATFRDGTKHTIEAGEDND
jgi:hypothetical protein